MWLIRVEHFQLPEGSHPHPASQPSQPQLLARTTVCSSQAPRARGGPWLVTTSWQLCAGPGGLRAEVPGFLVCARPRGEHFVFCVSLALGKALPSEEQG